MDTLNEGTMQVPQEILKEIPQLLPLTPGHFAALETALGAMGRDIGTALNVAYEAYAVIVEKYIALAMQNTQPTDEESNNSENAE